MNYSQFSEIYLIVLGSNGESAFEDHKMLVTRIITRLLYFFQRCNQTVTVDCKNENKKYPNNNP